MTDLEWTNQGAETVVISNAFDDGNRGGAAITSATVDFARKVIPGCNVTLVAIRNEPGEFQTLFRHTTARHPEVEVVAPPVSGGKGPLSGLRAFLKSLFLLIKRPGQSAPDSVQRILEASLVVSKGGYVFVDRRNIAGVLSLWVTAFPLILASRFGIPTVVYATSIGPMEHRWSRILNGWILRRTTLVLPRDPLSYQRALGLGVKAERLILTQDSVFGVTPPTEEFCKRTAGRFGLSGIRYGCVAVRIPKNSQKSYEDLLRRYIETIRGILHRNIVDKIVVVVQASEDSEVSITLVNHIGDPRVIMMAEDLGPFEMMGLYGASEFTLSGRLHGAIFSLISGTPAIVIDIENTKAKGVYMGLRLEELVISLDELSPEYLPDVVADVVSMQENVRKTISAAVEESRITVERSIDHAVNMLSVGNKRKIVKQAPLV